MLRVINFRMPAELRSRLHRFAKRRYLGEAEALRLIVAEFLDEDESQRDLLKAERWQLKIFSDARAGRLTEPAK